MLEYLEQKILNKILDNCNFSDKKGMIIASPSNDPPYKFHWIRDSALVMRVFIDLYIRTKENTYLLKLIDYVEYCRMYKVISFCKTDLRLPLLSFARQ